MDLARDLLVDVVKDTLAESLREADVIKAVRRSAIAYKYLSLASVGIECGIHVVGQNYPGAVLVLARQVVSDAVSAEISAFIIEHGGFAARLQLDLSEAARHREVMAALFKGHVAVPWIVIAEKEAFWAPNHADEVASKAMAAVDLAGSMLSAAAATARRIRPRIYHRISWNSSARYAGTWADKTREGWGRVTFPGQGSYAGVWDKDEPFGFGRRDFPDGSYFVGEIRPTLSDGQKGLNALGMSVSADGERVFVGEHRFPFILFNDGRLDRDNPEIAPNGWGVEITRAGYTRGYWNQGERQYDYEIEETFYEKLALEARQSFEEHEKKYPSYFLTAIADKNLEIAKLRYRTAIRNAQWSRLLEDATARRNFYVYTFDRV